MQKRFIGAIVATAFLSAALVPAIVQTASAAPAIVKPAYVAGASVARTPTYDAESGLWSWKCSYAGWAGVKVNYTCALYTGTGTLVAGPHTGSFSNGGHDTALYYSPKGSAGTICTVADAEYNDGSAGDEDRKCN